MTHQYVTSGAARNGEGFNIYIYVYIYIYIYIYVYTYIYIYIYIYTYIYHPYVTSGIWHLPGSANFHVAWTGVAEILGVHDGV